VQVAYHDAKDAAGMPKFVGSLDENRQ